MQHRSLPRSTDRALPTALAKPARARRSTHVLDEARTVLGEDWEDRIEWLVRTPRQERASVAIDAPPTENDTMLDRHDVLATFLDAAAAAAEVVMCVYAESDPGVELKGPHDPVTRADKLSNALIVERLRREFPGVPIVAEESAPSSYEGFSGKPCAFFVDAVDGTQDFIARTGDFSIMLGFAEAGRPTVGVVHCPALGEVYGAAEGVGAFRITKEGRAPIHVGGKAELCSCRGAISRFHRGGPVDAKLGVLGLRELVPMGSAGIKAARVASGELDIYAHPMRAVAKLWDACAPDAIVRAAGGLYTDGSGRPFDYRGGAGQNEGTLAANATLHAEALRRFAAAEAWSGSRSTA